MILNTSNHHCIAATTMLTQNIEMVLSGGDTFFLTDVKDEVFNGQT
jgi:hypothetical protein